MNLKVFYKLAASSQFKRFCSVGVLNTVVDVSAYSLLHSASVPIFVANFMSTTLGLGTSFLLHSSYTFGNTQQKGSRLRQLIPFILVTCVGLWVIQPLVIRGVLNANISHHFLQPIAALSHGRTIAYSVIPKLCATVVTFIWNYSWYSRVIYRKW